MFTKTSLTFHVQKKQPGTIQVKYPGSVQQQDSYILGCCILPPKAVSTLDPLDLIDPHDLLDPLDLHDLLHLHVPHLLDLDCSQ